jgi:iron(III) transport system ATP-binding protein
MVVLDINNISKKYPGAEKSAVEDFSLAVKKGEIIALLGESGCGKTTMLRLIAGFEAADSGEIILHGKAVDSRNFFVEPEMRGVGIVFQDYALFPHLTVEENVLFGLFRLPKAKARQRLLEVLELTRLSDYRKRYPHQLSGGQQQRVALARAIAPNPEVLLFDEPFSNLDTQLKEGLRREIQHIVKKTGITSIFVTHDTSDVMAIAQKVVLMKEGKIVQTGSPEEIYNHPKNQYAALFFGKTNFLTATADDLGLQLPFGKIRTPLGIFYKGKTLSVSLRPDSFKILNQPFEHAVEGKIVGETFFGKYKELMVEVSTKTSSRNLIIFTQPHAVFPSGIIYFNINTDGLSVLEQ